VADWERGNGPELPEVAKPTGKRVAVVGSGPAGLTAAAELARAGHAVTIFESLHEAGGVLTYGIPAFRLPKEVVKAEIDQVLALGARLKKNHLAGRSISMDELLDYDAVFLGTGAGLPAFMCIPGENLNGVYSANEFLTRVNLMHADAFPAFDTPVLHGARVAVIGGGNVAMDSARVARRLGAKVSLIYRRGEEEMPAPDPDPRRAVLCHRDRVREDVPLRHRRKRPPVPGADRGERVHSRRGHGHPGDRYKPEPAPCLPDPGA
jgi:glutamate synthase (NADPH/NADH) small chain